MTNELARKEKDFFLPSGVHLEFVIAHPISHPKIEQKTVARNKVGKYSFWVEEGRRGKLRSFYTVSFKLPIEEDPSSSLGNWKKHKDILLLLCSYRIAHSGDSAPDADAVLNYPNLFLTFFLGVIFWGSAAWFHLVGRQQSQVEGEPPTNTHSVTEQGGRNKDYYSIGQKRQEYVKQPPSSSFGVALLPPSLTFCSSEPFFLWWREERRGEEG